MYKPGDVVFLPRGSRPWSDFLKTYEKYFVTHFNQSGEDKAIGPGKTHEVRLEFEVPDEVTRVQVRLVSFVVGPRLNENTCRYYTDIRGARIMYYTWRCEPVDEVLAPEVAFNATGQRCHVYIDRFVIRKRADRKLEPIERLVPIEDKEQKKNPAKNDPEIH